LAEVVLPDLLYVEPIAPAARTTAAVTGSGRTTGLPSSIP
jgi:hypothetical protein